METDARRWISALRGSHERLTAFAAGLDDDDLGTQSMCTDWTVARVLGHLGSQAEIGLAGWEANLAGRDPPGPGANPPIWDRWNAMPPREAAAAFVDADRRLLQVLEGLDANQLDTMQIKLAFLPEPIDVASAVGFRLGEHSLHSWDVFAAFDAGATLAADATELLIDRLPMIVGMIGRFTPRDTRPADAVTISVETSDPARRYALELGETVALEPADRTDGYDGALAIPSEGLLRLTSGRLRPDRPSGEVEPSGALSLADLRRAFPGY
jgi:uncharacterized protein (TIGR03083 family)